MTPEGYDAASRLQCHRQYEQWLDSPSLQRHQPADGKTQGSSCDLQRRSKWHRHRQDAGMTPEGYLFY